MKSENSLSIFFPCYNDAGTIGSLVQAADSVASEFYEDYEIIVVDDCSTDTSRDLLINLKKKYSKLSLIFHNRNQGYGGALRSGFKHSSKELIFYTDGDGQYDVFELRKSLRIMQDGIDAVNGYKIDRNDPLHRIIIGRIYNTLMKILFNIHIRDIDCDYRLIRRSALKKFNLTHNTGTICLELVKKLELTGCRFAEFPVSHYHRIYGKSQFFNFKRLLYTVVNILKLRYQIALFKRELPSQKKKY